MRTLSEALAEKKEHEAHGLFLFAIVVLSVGVVFLSFGYSYANRERGKLKKQETNLAQQVRDLGGVPNPQRVTTTTTTPTTNPVIVVPQTTPSSSSTPDTAPPVTQNSPPSTAPTTTPSAPPTSPPPTTTPTTTPPTTSCLVHNVVTGRCVAP